MNRSIRKLRHLLAVSLILLVSATVVSAQQEISEEDGQPVLIKHLPDYERAQAGATFVTDKPALLNATGGNPILDVLDFPPGTEAVTAVYPEGRLVIVEYTNPQSSIEADSRVQQFLTTAPQPDLAYRRIGNYNVFVLGTQDMAGAGTLLDQIRYQKTVQWLGEDPYLLKKLERYMIGTSRDIVISTVLVIVLGLGGSLLTGILAGFVFFRIRDQKRAHRTTYSDAGGLTRLNLDGLSE